MKANYKNWMPRGMIAAAALASLICFGLFGVICLLPAFTARTALLWILFAAAVLLCAASVWMTVLYRAFSYGGKRQLSKQIVDGVAAYVKIPDGGRGLDVGCGSGALTIACAKSNPASRMVGIDRWGFEYASFSKELCEQNAKAEGVGNVEFLQGNAIKLDFPDESFDAVTSNYVYHNVPVRDRQKLLLETLRVLKRGGVFVLHDIMSASKYGDMAAFVKELRDMGFEKVELIDTTGGMFMSRREALLLGLRGSALLVGKK